MKYNSILAAIIFLGSLHADSSIYAQPALTISTDQLSYIFGESVVISGNVGELQSGHQLTLSVYSDGNREWLNRDVFVNADGSYSYIFNLDGLKEGQYTAYAKYGDNESSTSFSYSVPHSLMSFSPFRISTVLGDDEFVISGRITSGISPEKLTIVPGMSINLELTANRLGIMEMTLPKTMIEDINTVEMVATDYSASPDFEILSSNATDSTVRIVVLQEAREIIIGGAHIVPEFSRVSLVVLALSVVAVIGSNMIRKKIHML